MQFGPWYPLAEAGDRAPAAEGMLQLKIAHGLIDYPRGKSAMVHYAHATDVRAAALALAAAHAGEDLLCRHLIEIEAAPDVAGIWAPLPATFVDRFGAPPSFARPSR